MYDDSTLLTILPIFVLAILAGLLWLCYQGGERLQTTVEDTLAWMGHKLKQTLPDQIDIETVDDDKTFVLKDGSRMTLVRINGTFQLIGEEEFAEIDNALSSSLNAYLRSGGHEMHTIFNDDPDSIERIVREKLRPSMETAKRLQLSLDDLFEEDVRTMSKYCSHEAVYMVLLTRPSALTRHDRKRDLQTKLEVLKANPLPSAKDAPNLFAAIGALRTRHASYVTQFLGDLRQMKIDAEALEVHEACREMRASADPEFTDENWRACLFGDKIPLRMTGKDGDVSGALWPRIEPQLVPRDAIEKSLHIVEVGDRIYAPMHVTVQAAEIKPFAVLFRRVRETRMPWRITFRVAAGGLGTMNFKGIIGALFGWTSRDNTLIEEGIKYVQQAIRNGASADVAFRVDFMTWAPKGQEKLLEDRAAKLARAVQGWGSLETAQVSGDVTEAFVANAVGMRLSGVGPVSCAVLDDVTPMLPLYRPTSPWRDGAVLYRSPDGKIWPYQPNSPVQSSWISLIYAEMRAGKSVNGNQINLGLCLSPGIVRLPLIAVVDIGRASAGLISLLQHALPESLRYQVASIRLRMTPEYAVNPFDTQLGARHPMPQEKVFQRNFIATLITPPGQAAAEDGLIDLAAMAIDESYKLYAEKGAKRYVRDLVPMIDTLLDKHLIDCDDRTTWWEVVDALFDREEYHGAVIAQRYAMPLLSEIATIAREPMFQDMYGEKKLQDGEHLLVAFGRRLSAAVRNYPILAQPTQFDIGLARVVSIDLDEVAKAGSAEARRQTAMVYMLARHITARNFFLHTDDVRFFPERYRDFQDKRIRDIMQDKKHLQYDEFHITDGVQAIRDQVVADMRVTGKVGVMVTLISQSIKDFDPLMLEFATSKFVLSRATKAVADDMKRIFGLSATVEYAIQREIRPPSRDGSTFIGIFKTKASEADAIQLLKNTVGGIKLWAFSTTNEDAIVRDAMYLRVGPAEARRFLAKVYPGGSVLDEIERRKKAMSQSAMVDINDKGEGVINQLIDDLKALYEETRKKDLAA